MKKGLSNENQNDWIQAIQLNYEKKKYIAAYLKWNLKEKNLFDFPCFTKPVVQEDFRGKIMEICSGVRPFLRRVNKMCQRRSLLDENTETVKILAPLTDNPNASKEFGGTPIYWAAIRGFTEIVKSLVPLTDNPNAPNILGKTPIYVAARNGHIEIVKILAPLTDNPLKWDVKQVCDFVKNLPGCSDYVEDFQHQEIDGQALMLLKADHLMQAMAMKLGPALQIYKAITALHVQIYWAAHDGNT